jgi:uncharacterized membrane protein/uncharacterized membrane protein YphA (DoxX/SURF4 family)
MQNISYFGRIFYSLAVAETGFQTIYYGDFPYWLFPPNHGWVPALATVAHIFGILLVLAGACFGLEKKTRPVSLLTGDILLLIFCFCFIPYQFMNPSTYMHLAEWENAEKELSFCSGAFVLAAGFPGGEENRLDRFLRKLIPLGPLMFSIPMISFGILHFLYTKEASTLVPVWIPGPVFGVYVGGVALIGSGVAIVLKIKARLIATLLGTMILTWVLILHIPRVIAASPADLGGELTSAFLALAYSGIAWMIAGARNTGIS